MRRLPHIKNFGRDVSFTPQDYYEPKNEAEILVILERHHQQKIRPIGSRHAWNPSIKGTVVVNLQNFQQVQIHRRNADSDDHTCVSIGAGCQIKTVLAHLNAEGLTLPSIGLIAEQTIAGAIATGTHGSGRHSLSHYVQAVRLTCYDPSGEIAQIQPLVGGQELIAARCAIGSLGIITEVTLPCIPQYYVTEKATPCATIEAALALEAQSPLQQFFLMPHQWQYVVQERSVSKVSQPSQTAWLYRLYWLINLDLGLHLLIKLFAARLRSRSLVHFLFRQILPRSLFPNWVVTDRSDRQLLMNHSLFRHFELEAFVPRSQLVAASKLITDILQLADDPHHQLTTTTQTQLKQINLLTQTEQLRGRFTHHYPICFRRIQPDDTMLSMSAGGTEDWYAISFITYCQPRDDFQAVASLLAHSLFPLFQGRIHWGKWFPIDHTIVTQQYPRLEEFRKVRDRFDPKHVFSNQFIQNKIG